MGNGSSYNLYNLSGLEWNNFTIKYYDCHGHSIVPESAYYTRSNQLSLKFKTELGSIEIRIKEDNTIYDISYVPYKNKSSMYIIPIILDNQTIYEIVDFRKRSNTLINYKNTRTSLYNVHKSYTMTKKK